MAILCEMYIGMLIATDKLESLLDFYMRIVILHVLGNSKYSTQFASPFEPTKHNMVKSCHYCGSNKICGP